jgi:hypothetical protein
MREPWCSALRPGTAHLGWDASVYPEAMVRDPRTGTVLGFGRDGSATFTTGASHLEVKFLGGDGPDWLRLEVHP